MESTAGRWFLKPPTEAVNCVLLWLSLGFNTLRVSVSSEMLNIIDILVQHQPAEMCLIILENTVQKLLFHIRCLA